ncbi:MAG: hypothetical protein WB441_15620 [Nocardioidaceae bacterium]
MPRRVSVPAADELFRPTVVPDADAETDASAPTAEPALPMTVAPLTEPGPEPAADPPAGLPGLPAAGGRSSSGRVRHDHKMTVYVTSEELLDLDSARLTLRRVGIGVDRGRLVREAVAMALADLDTHGTDGELVRRLADRPSGRPPA